MNRAACEKNIQSVIEAIRDKRGLVECTGIPDAGRAYLVSCLAADLRGAMVIVMPTLKACQALAGDLDFFSSAGTPDVDIFPPYNILPFKQIAYDPETAAQRIRILYHLAVGSGPRIIIAPVESLLSYLIPKQVVCNYAELLMKGEETDRDQLIRKLDAGGYSRVSLVEAWGEYSVRGGIMDIYSPMYDDPLRIEMYGDIVDSIRFFSSVTQRKLTDMEEAIILPAREALLDGTGIRQVIQRARAYRNASGEKMFNQDAFIEQIGQEGVFPGVEGFLPLIYPGLDTVFDYVSQDTTWVRFDPDQIDKQADDYENLVVRNYMRAREDDRFCLEPDRLYQDWASVRNRLEECSRLTLQDLPTGPAAKGIGRTTRIRFSIRDNTDLSEKLLGGKKDEAILLPLSEWIKEKQDAGYLTLLVCSTDSQSLRLQSLLQPYGIQALMKDLRFHQLQRHPGQACICKGRLSGGFVWHEQSLAIITETEIFGAKTGHRRGRERRQGVQAGLIDFSDLNIGDYVVHLQHGIGLYQGLTKLTIEGRASDFLLVEYRDRDKLYIPVDRLDMISRYMGVDGVTPTIDKMGGRSWQRVTARAKKSVEKIAGELLSLYAARKVAKGHAYAPADNYVKEFEAGFPYEETPDQIRAIDEVMDDMEVPTPMDRLICGDVGYGKTEVALRASFKAVNDGKQVAILVPTTLLAEQHYATFSERFARYPVIIDCLSRFRSKKQQGGILKRLAEGRTDIVIGTHRLLQKDIAFKDLGLIVIDEEQRFGVKHKERLKRMRTAVDVLSMTATPIPRTLHMSLMGIRDISVIQTPPEMRRSIVSYISEFDPAVIIEAVRKELGRGGQVFFVHNNIHTIWNLADHIEKLIPEVRLGVAHGRLSEADLEQVMFRFLNREIDMLLTTTIVESGLDIPNANTIIINRADRFGLAQIYQLRGRVGRSDEQAYAYLFVPKAAALTRDARKRLKVLMEYSDLGAGFQIAMSDLKIRGGGAALGVEQSGHIAAVGYDMFLTLLEEAVSRLKGKPVIERLEPEISIPLSVFIPESYIEDIDQRLLAYRRLARMTHLKEIADFKDELTDRYGEPPAEVGNLLLKIMLKVLCIKAGVKKLDLTNGFAVFSFSSLHQKNPLGITRLIDSTPDRFLFIAENSLRARLKRKRVGGAIAETRNILMDIAEFVNN